MRTTDDAMRWVWRASAIAVVVIGWVFILFHNNMHVTPPVVFIGLGYTAGVAAIYALFRTGASAVSREVDDRDDAAWGLPLGARGELEREKRTLLKAIKEAEFDHQMGKLSKRDVEEMIRNYRLRAIEVIKLLEGTAGTPREQIQREVRARLEVEAVRNKIERAHADLGQRKNTKRAGDAARMAALTAAARGASGAEAAAAAAAAAAQVQAEPDPDEAVAAESTAEAPPVAYFEGAAYAGDDAEVVIPAATQPDDAQAEPEQAKEATS